MKVDYAPYGQVEAGKRTFKFKVSSRKSTDNREHAYSLISFHDNKIHFIYTE